MARSPLLDSSGRQPRRGWRTLALVAGAGIGAALGGWALATPADAAVPCSIYWTGAVSDLWTSASNWSFSDGGARATRVPASTDVVCMSTTPVRSDVTYISIGRVVAGIDFSVADSVRPSLTLAGGTLVIGSALGETSSVINDLAIDSGAVLSGTADIELTGAPTLTDDPVMSGPGTTTLAAGTEVETTGLVLDGGRRLVNLGTLTHNGCYDYFYLYNGAVLQNSGTFVAASSCGQLVHSDGTPGTRIVNDAGAMFRVQQDPGAVYDLHTALDNDGTVSVEEGALQVTPTGASQGSWQIAAGARLEVVPGGLMRLTDGAVTGAGTLTVAGGTVDAAPATHLSTVDLGSGVLSGDPTVDNLSASPGAVFTGGGTLTIPASGTATLAGLTVDGGSLLENRGTLLHVDCLGDLVLLGSSTLQNDGDIIATPSCTRGISGDAGSEVNNDGTITISPTTLASVYSIDVALHNSGRIEVTKARGELSDLTNLSGGRLTGGTYVASGGALQLPTAVTTNAASIELGGSGSIPTPSTDNGLTTLTNNTGTLLVSRALTITTPLQNSGAITVTAGTLTATTFTQTAGVTTLAAGTTLRGSGGAASITIDGGVFAGAGTVNVLAGNGTVAPTPGPTPLTISQNYGPGVGGTLSAVIQGAGASGVGTLAVGGKATLGGTLAITTDPGFTPVNGAKYTLVTMESRVGTFATVTGQALPGGGYYDIAYGATSVVATVRSLPALTITDAAQSVGDAGGAPMTFTVALTAASSQVVTVDYQTVEGTATAPEDYAAASGTLTFPVGVTSLPVTVTIARDNGSEPVETFTVTLSGADNAVLDDGVGIGTITHQSGAPTAPIVTGLSPDTIGPGAVDRQLDILGSNFLTTSSVTLSGTGITITGKSLVDSTRLRLTLNASSSAALGDRDVTVTNAGLGTSTCAGCLTVTPKPLAATAGPPLGVGAVDQTVTVSGTGFSPGAIVKIQGQSGVTVGTTTYVSPSTLRSTVSVSKTAAVGGYDVKTTNADGGVATCTGCFTVVAGPTVTSVTPGTVIRGADTDVTVRGSRFVTGATVTPPPDITASNVRVVDATTITATLSVSPTRTRSTDLPLSVTNGPSAGYGVGSCTCLTVGTLVSINDAQQSVGNAGPAEMTFTVSLDASAPTSITVAYQTVAGSATAGTDYVATSGTLTFSPGTTSRSVVVTIAKDVAADPDETFTVVLSNPTNAAIGDGTGVGTIIHQQGAAAIPRVTSVDPGSVGPGSSGTTLTLTGANFTAGTAVTLGGGGITLTGSAVVNSTTMTITVNVPASSVPGPRDVTVTTPGVGSSTCGGCLVVTAAPAPASTTPSLQVGAAGATLTLAGTGFKSGAVVSFPGTAAVKVATASVTSATSIRLTVNVTGTAPTGGYDVRVTNPDGGVGTCSRCFTVLAGPTVSAIVPGVVVRGTTVPVTILGSRFATGADVLDLPDITFSNVLVVSPSTITATMRVAGTRTPGSNITITVVNPASAGSGQGSCACLQVTKL